MKTKTGKIGLGVLIVLAIAAIAFMSLVGPARAAEAAGPDPNEIFIQSDDAGGYFRLITSDETVYDFDADAWAAAPTYAHSCQAMHQKTINRGWYADFPSLMETPATARGGKHIIQIGFNATPASTDTLTAYEFEWDKHNGCIVKGSLREL